MRSSFEANPYAPPAHDHDPRAFAPATVEGCWRDGDAAVVYRPIAELPDRCVRCNQPASGFRLQKKLYWHHPAAYVALFISPIVYVIVAMIIRKSATVRIGLCPDHRRRRRNGMLIGWIGSAISLTACTAGIAADTPEALLGGIALFLVFPIVGIVMARTIVPKKMDEHRAWFKVSKLFLDSLDTAR